MDSAYTINLSLSVFLLVTSVVVIVLQGMAYLRHRHISFLILALSTAIIIVGDVVALVPYFMQMAESQWLPHSIIYAIIGAAATLLSVAGIVLLFRSYRDLVEGHARANARISQLEAQLAATQPIQPREPPPIGQA
ncbi:hypothetical protein [Stenotrophomonas sp.]|uniref:hypothetical protein n=1 Tax=Stenotrophomonas sp. TaxID=69392 RepID=UPI00289E09F0|nr:hypothetical protein [Stenotrophomonas sp.]